jgi:glycosyltransferase involved in cell wall biosynthesis
LRIAFDATYSVGPELSGVGTYSRRIIAGIAACHPECKIALALRAHRLRESLEETIPKNSHRVLLTEWGPLCRYRVFHGLNQRLPKRRLRRSVATFHDLFVMTSEYSTPEFRERFTEQARHAADAADVIIAVSGFTARQIEDLLRVPASRIRVVPHGATFPTRHLNEPREPMILTAGTLQTRKNVSRLVEAF